ncbi:Alpha/Beta hydrolase protein [Apiosordaria backusii]|uniref:Alpha/Beta hydrolase protein n=1 Tax=Apiosordaria backusii TaxID=314023 RepID=A0AA40BJK6_9PEZI|nr:Alpha/Beta hydrolase protein [Apiosordaria backusii]
MGFFVRSKKVKKDSPKPSAKDQPSRTSGQRQLPPPPPPPPSSQVSQNWHHGRPYLPSSPQFQPAGLLPPPSGWEAPYQAPYPSPPIIVNQHHYYLGPPPPFPPRDDPPTRSQSNGCSMNKLNLDSAVDLAKNLCQETGITKLFDSALSQSPLSDCGSQLVDQSNALLNQISNQFNDVLTMIDRDHYKNHEREILSWQPEQPSQSQELMRVSDSSLSEKSMHKPPKRSHRKDHPKGQTTAAATVVSGSIFSKVELYANSRLPMNLQPLKLYIPTYPLLCLAAQYSERVYEKPTGAESDTHVDADWRAGTKAMVIKSMPMDYMNTIVFSVRGTATFMDWAVNLKTDPVSPAGFLDDPHNLCHSGFLSVARKMVVPVARRLRQLLEEDPSRAAYSLLITGHSAGGAVASLLYMHMLSTSKAAESELNNVAGFFKRIHCVTFGTPPISLRPLTKPEDYDRRPQLRKSLFLSFVNEGDPVARADKAYVKSLLELFAAPAPPAIISSRDAANKKVRTKEKAPSSKSSKSSPGPVWKVPPNRLSSAGRIVVLRSGDPKARSKGKKKTVEERLNEGVIAQITTDEQLRGVIWGDPVAHVMRLYAGRIETLAVGAVTGRGY